MAEIDARDWGLGSQPNIPDSLDIGVTENWKGIYDKHLGSLGNKGRRLKSGEGESQVSMVSEVWLERHPMNCHPGEGRQLFLGGDEKAGG